MIFKGVVFNEMKGAMVSLRGDINLRIIQFNAVIKSYIVTVLFWLTILQLRALPFNNY